MIKFLRQHNPNTYQTLLFWVLEGRVVLDVVLRQVVRYTMMSHLPVLLRKCYLLNCQQSHPNTHAHLYRQTEKDQPYTAQSFGISQHGRDERMMKEVLLSLCGLAKQKKKYYQSGQDRCLQSPLPHSPSFSFSLNNADLSDLGKQFNDRC